MEVSLTAAQQAFIQRGIASGRYKNAEDAVNKALTRWEEEERTAAELLFALEEAEIDISDGRFAEYTTTSLAGLADELKTEARAIRGRPRV